MRTLPEVARAAIAACASPTPVRATVRSIHATSWPRLARSKSSAADTDQQRPVVDHVSHPEAGTADRPLDQILRRHLHRSVLVACPRQLLARQPTETSRPNGAKPSSAVRASPPPTESTNRPTPTAGGIAQLFAEIGSRGIEHVVSAEVAQPGALAGGGGQADHRMSTVGQRQLDGQMPDPASSGGHADGFAGAQPAGKYQRAIGSAALLQQADRLVVAEVVGQLDRVPVLGSHHLRVAAALAQQDGHPTPVRATNAPRRRRRVRQEVTTVGTGRSVAPGRRSSRRPAVTSTRLCPAAASGSGSSSTANTSGPPVRRITTAFIRCSPGVRPAGQPAAPARNRSGPPLWRTARAPGPAWSGRPPDRRRPRSRQRFGRASGSK